MLDATTETGLDVIQLAALRKADRVCFYHRAAPDASGFASYISAIKENKPSASDPFAREQVLIVSCDHRLVDYSRGDDAKIPYGSDNWAGFEMIHAAQHDETWPTTASLLRVGDKLTLLWARGAWTTQGMENAAPAFFGDTLHLRVERGDKRLTFHVGASVCEDNSARMIRTRGIGV